MRLHHGRSLVKSFSDCRRQLSRHHVACSFSVIAIVRSSFSCLPPQFLAEWNVTSTLAERRGSSALPICRSATRPAPGIPLLELDEGLQGATISAAASCSAKQAVMAARWGKLGNPYSHSSIGH